MATHYVATDGTASWANSTNINTPCSQATARSDASDGDIVYFLSGTYTSTIRFDNAGVIARSYVLHEAIVDNSNLNECMYSNVDGVTFDGFFLKPHKDYGARNNSSGTNTKYHNLKIIHQATNLSTANGIYVEGGGAGYEIVGCDISASLIGIINYSTTGFAGLIKNNYIHDLSSHSLSSSDGIRVIAGGDFDGLIIEYNEIENWTDDAIDFFGGRNVVARYNYIHDSSGLYHGNGIKMGGTTGNSNIAYGNYIENLSSLDGDLGIAFNTNSGDDNVIFSNIVVNAERGVVAYSGTDGTRIYNNYFDCTERGVSVADCDDTIVKNNILSASGGSDPYDMKLGTVTNFIGKYNIFVNDAATKDSLASKYTITDELFETDPKVSISVDGVITIDSDSPTIGGGEDLGGSYDVVFTDDTVLPDDLDISTQDEQWTIGPFYKLSSTSLAPTTLSPTSLSPTTLAPTTLAPTTLAPTTLVPTTVAPTSLAPTTLAPTTIIPPEISRRGIKNFGFSMRPSWR